MMEGESRDFTVVLSQEPTGNVTVTIVVRDGAAMSLDRTELTFTPSNWNQPQTVKMIAEQDMDIVDNDGALILIASGGGYGGDGVIVSPETATIKSLGETVQLKATVQDQDGESVTGVSLEWSSADSSVAVVDSVGEVTAVSFGMTTVTAAFATAFGTARISVTDPSSPPDREVLEVLFKATGGERWTRRDGWLSDAPVREWYGVQTDAEEGHVKGLLLGYNNLTGSLPPSLGRLHKLENLVLDENRLAGRVPSEFSNLKQLKFLNLAGNFLTGPIPSELNDMVQLKFLNLADNSLSGSVPPELSNLMQLERVWLHDNSLSGQIPPELGDLAQLKELDLGRNFLTGLIPPELGNLAELVKLNLHINSLKGPIPSELGNLSKLEQLWLFSNSLSGPIPSELGNLSKLEDLNLNSNSLSDPIPSELGNSAQLKFLLLYNNALTGLLPSELGNLTQLSLLWLHDNSDLEGFLPRSFVGISPESVNVTNTGICRQQDAVFLEWWNSILDSRVDDCMPEQIERLALLELYNKTNGTSWTSSRGWATDDPLGNWYGVTVENGRITELSLPNNSLNGSISGEIGNFTELAVLNLASNSLVGTLPKEIPHLSNLTELRVNGNTGLDGVLKDDVFNLTKLEVLHFEDTSLCLLPSQMFQTWYENIGDASGAFCSNPAEVRLDIPVVYLTQSVQTPQRSVRLIEGRDALLRVFVTGTPQPAFFRHEVVATVRGGGRTHRVEMTRPGDQLAIAVDESDLDNSFNAVIPGDFITSDATLVVEADPDGIVPRAPGSQDRFPDTGEVPLNVTSVPAMEVTVVPVLEAYQPDRSILEWTDNISDNSPEVGLFKYAFPFHEFHARSRDPYFTSLDLTSDDGQWGLVQELEALRLLDRATGYYYGAAASFNGFVRGIARLGGWTSMGKAWDTELAHEVGHNLNLDHAPCGNPMYIDPDFPHADGGVGVWGFDFRHSTLISPKYHKDIMGYCYDQGWLSDYFFEKVIDYRERVEGKVDLPIAGAVHESDVLVLWGGVQGGELRIEPPFPATALPQLPETDGPYRLEGFGQNAVLFALSFTPGEDKFGNKYFFFAIPIEQEWGGSLEQITLTGLEGSVTIDANDGRELSIFRDAQTGQVRGILRDWNGTLPAALEQSNDFTVETIQGFTDSASQQR